MSDDRNEALRLAEFAEQISNEGPMIHTMSWTQLAGTFHMLAALLRQQAERIAELEARVHTCGPTCSKAGCINRRVTAERDQLRAEVERLRPNAERWEWIADGDNFDDSFALLTDPKLTTYELTRAVDAARTTHKDEA